MRTYGIRTYGMRTYGIRTYGMRTYGMRTYGMRTYGLFVFNWGGIKPRRSPSEGVRPSPFMLAWVTNVSTSPDLYIEFSTGY